MTRANLAVVGLLVDAALALLAALELEVLDRVRDVDVLRSIPASSSAASSSFPRGRRTGWPACSSWSPGCSPTNMTVALRGPSPNTTRPHVQRSHPRQLVAASRSFGSVARGGMKSAAEPVPSPRCRTASTSGARLHTSARASRHRIRPAVARFIGLSPPNCFSCVFVNCSGQAWCQTSTLPQLAQADWTGIRTAGSGSDRTNRKRS